MHFLPLFSYFICLGIGLLFLLIQDICINNINPYIWKKSVAGVQGDTLLCLALQLGLISKKNKL